MNPERVGAVFAVGLFLGTLLLIEAGRRRRLQDRARAGGEAEGLGAMEGALFGLLGLLLAFTFSGAAGRFDDRRQLIVEEANAIGTAYLRLDLLSAEPRAALQARFREYVEARLGAYRALPDLKAAYAGLARADSLQAVIWTGAASATQAASTTAPGMLLLPALNAMIDITTTRTAATQAHPPFMIFVMLGLLVLVCAYQAGYGMGEGTRRSWIHIMGFAVVLALTIYLIIDLEYPRLGLIQVSSYDQFLVKALEQMR